MQRVLTMQSAGAVVELPQELPQREGALVARRRDRAGDQAQRGLALVVHARECCVNKISLILSQICFNSSYKTRVARFALHRTSSGNCMEGLMLLPCQLTYVYDYFRTSGRS